MDPPELPQSTRASIAILKLATRQNGVVSRQQLLALGLNPALIRKRAASLRLIPIYRGTYAVGHARLTQRGWWTAAVLTGGRHAALSHQSAAALWGFLPAPNNIEIVRPSSPPRTSPKLTRLGSRPALTIHRSRHCGADDFEFVDGIRVTSVARTFLDIANELSERNLESALTEAERLHLVKIKRFEEATSRGKGWSGSQRLREVLDGWDPSSLDARTDLELLFVTLCRDHDLELPELNVWVNGFLVDGFWPSKNLVVELDGHRYHRSTWQFNRDLEHTIALEDAGYGVIRLNWIMLTKERRQTAARVRRRLDRSSKTGDQA